MSIGEVAGIIYKFSWNELTSMLRLLGCEKVPGTDIEANVPVRDALEGLIENGIAMPCGDRVLVDKTIAIVIVLLSRSDKYLALRTEDGWVNLYDCGKMYVIVSRNGDGPVKIDPVKNIAEAEIPLMAELERIGSGVEAIFRNGNESCDVDADDMIDLKALFDK